MRTIFFFGLTLWLGLTQSVYAQSSKDAKDFGNIIMIDSNSTLILPVQYEGNLFSSGKYGYWGNNYANLIFYNFKTDTYKKLFGDDTYIKRFYNYDYYDRRYAPNLNHTKQYIFYLVVDTDRNKNGKIDDGDPVTLYVSTLYGENLRRISSTEENVISFKIFEKENFAMIEIQRDVNKDNNFTWKDNDFYYIKLDLGTLSFGKPIEIK
jgi:hypothetical protein